MAEVVNKFRRGLKFRVHLYVDNAGQRWLFNDQPSCPKEVARWEARGIERAKMTDQERLQDSIKEHYDSEPRKGYNPSCDCDVCKMAHLARYFKGMLGAPSAASLTKGEMDPRFTFQAVTDKVNKLTETWRGFQQEDAAKVMGIVAENKLGSQSAWEFNLPKTKFEAAMFRIVREMWVEDTTAQRFYNVPPDQAKYINRHQPDWGYLHGIDEVAELQRDPELSPELYSRRIIAVNAPGPFTEAQAMLVFGTIRSVSAKGGIVIVNTDDIALKNYVTRLKKSLE